MGLLAEQRSGRRPTASVRTDHIDAGHYFDNVKMEPADNLRRSSAEALCRYLIIMRGVELAHSFFCAAVSPCSRRVASLSSVRTRGICIR